MYEIVRKWENGRFTFFPSIGMIGLRHSRDRVADRWAINKAAKALKAAGFEVEVEIDDTPRDRAQVLADKADRLEDRRHALAAKAERHAGRAAAAAERANDLSERFAGGQPILLGHHSERGARRDQKRMDTAMRKSVEEDTAAQQAARRANAVGKQAAYSARPRVTARRIKKLEADLRRVQRGLDGYERVFRNHRGEPYYIEKHEPATGQHRERLLAEQAHIENQLAYERQQLAAATQEGEFVEWGKHNIHVGDRVWAWGYNGLAVKTNPTTVRLDFRDHWQPKVPYTDILQVECPHGDKPSLAGVSEPARAQPARPKVKVPKLDTEQLQAAARRASSVRVGRDREAFVSPPAVVDKLMELADIQPGMAVLEPSAGTGNIAAAAVERGAVVDCVEIEHSLANLLVERVPGVNCVRRQDFLDLEQVEQEAYDRIVMNPPFSGGKDIAHVTHALRFLKPGGRLVAVMGSSVIFQQTKVAERFRALVEEHGGEFEPLPAGSFAPATDANTVVVVIPAQD
ncbi:protein-L-isoaspartate O-methyltransferase [Thermocatellispora tengchongensis]|uniref:Protein-L-isoaspartate O-methyltransferase n=1 Tax=Thermocatellispora tengchongensis TaxID=1073253 RepID=A0A840P4H5_9ACTN|nr:DUF3560 domain-containing protein [Thermocatellispora tengchongensis]MBB5132761.1 protein-L-isoaspartate O-methyltransferase [Thermocatellispora tengchongensis]